MPLFCQVLVELLQLGNMLRMSRAKCMETHLRKSNAEELCTLCAGAPLATH